MAEYVPGEAAEATAKKSNTGLIIAIVVVVLLICCCCASLVGFFAIFGEEIMRELGLAVPLLVAA